MVILLQNVSLFLLTQILFSFLCFICRLILFLAHLRLRFTNLAYLYILLSYILYFTTIFNSLSLACSLFLMGSECLVINAMFPLFAVCAQCPLLYTVHHMPHIQFHLKVFLFCSSPIFVQIVTCTFVRCTFNYMKPCVLTANRQHKKQQQHFSLKNIKEKTIAKTNI